MAHKDMVKIICQEWKSLGDEYKSQYEQQILNGKKIISDKIAL
jgi:hypothetical protein